LGVNAWVSTRRRPAAPAGCALPPRPPHPRSAAAARTHAPPFQEPAVAPAAAPAAAAASAPAPAPLPLLLRLSFVLGVGAAGGPGLSECQSAGTPRPNRQNGGPPCAFVGTLWHSDCLVRFFNKKS